MPRDQVALGMEYFLIPVKRRRNMAIKLNIVEIGNLGSFRLGSDTEDEVSAANMVCTRLLFSLGKHVKSVTKDLTFEKIR